MRKTDHERAEIRREVEARRQPGSDRTAHEAARGKKMQTLADLSKNDVQSEHLQDIMHELDNQSDRGVALIAAALVDTSLKRAMCTRLANFPNFHSKMFDGDSAPLKTFSARIKVSRAMGVIGDGPENHLDSIRKIRNQFAHSAFKIDFQNPLIAGEIDKLLPDDSQGWKPEFTPERRRYIGTAIALILALEKQAEDHLHDTIPIWIV